MEHNNNIELSTEEFLKKIENKLLSSIKKNEINYNNISNKKKKELFMKAFDNMWKDLDIDNKNDA